MSAEASLKPAEASLVVAEASLISAEASLIVAETLLASAETLLIVAETSLELAETLLSVAEASLSPADTSLAVAEASLYFAVKSLAFSQYLLSMEDERLIKKRGAKKFTMESVEVSGIKVWQQDIELCSKMDFIEKPPGLSEQRRVLYFGKKGCILEYGFTLKDYGTKVQHENTQVK